MWRERGSHFAGPGDNDHVIKERRAIIKNKANDSNVEYLNLCNFIYCLTSSNFNTDALYTNELQNVRFRTTKPPHYRPFSNPPLHTLQEVRQSLDDDNALQESQRK